MPAVTGLTPTVKETQPTPLTAWCCGSPPYALKLRFWTMASLVCSLVLSFPHPFPFISRGLTTNMGAAMVFFAFLCILLGVAPELLYRFLPYPVDYEAYTAGKVVFYLQLLLFSGLAFFLLLPLMRRTETISLDFDWIWRVGLVRLLQVLGGAWNRVSGALASLLVAIGSRLGRGGRRYFGSRVENGQQVHGMFARAWPIGTTALWIAVLLTAYVFFYYLA